MISVHDGGAEVAVPPLGEHTRAIDPSPTASFQQLRIRGTRDVHSPQHVIGQDADRSLLCARIRRAHVLVPDRLVRPPIVTSLAVAWRDVRVLTEQPPTARPREGKEPRRRDDQGHGGSDAPQNELTIPRVARGGTSGILRRDRTFRTTNGVE
jgi:hypothetical protein